MYSQSVDLREKYKQQLSGKNDINEQLAAMTRQLELQQRASEVEQVELKARLMLKYGEERKKLEETISELNMRVVAEGATHKSPSVRLDDKAILAQLASLEGMVNKNRAEAEQLRQSLPTE